MERAPGQDGLSGTVNLSVPISNLPSEIIFNNATADESGSIAFYISSKFKQKKKLNTRALCSSHTTPYKTSPGHKQQCRGAERENGGSYRLAEVRSHGWAESGRGRGKQPAGPQERDELPCLWNKGRRETIKARPFHLKAHYECSP